jgi:hypothetical protein
MRPFAKRSRALRRAESPGRLLLGWGVVTRGGSWMHFPIKRLPAVGLRDRATARRWSYGKAQTPRNGGWRGGGIGDYGNGVHPPPVFASDLRSR